MPSIRLEKSCHSFMGKMKPDRDLLLKEDYLVSTIPFRNISSKERRKERCTCTSTGVCLLILLASLATNVTLGAIFVYRVLHNSDSNSGQGDLINDADLSNSICVSCDSLQVHDPVTAPLMPKVKVIEKNVCCLQYSDHIQSLLNLVVAEHYHFHEYGKKMESFQIDLDIPAAHLYLQTSKTANYLEWDTDSGFGSSHISGGIVYKNGSLRVPEAGVYFLYSHITVIPTNNTGHLIHSIKRYNPQFLRLGENVLLFDKLSLEMDSQKTSYLGASLSLRKGDEVFVDVFNQSLIYDYAPANFFGMFLL